MISSIVNRQSSIYRGFTLIELLVVMGVLGVLATGLITIINPLAQFQKANDARRKEDLATIQKTLELYYSDNGKYPESSAGYLISPAGVDVNWGGSWVAYNTTIPADPSTSRNYVYFRFDSQTYYLYASLERGKNDSQVCNPDNDKTTDDKCTNVPVSATCGSVCDYGASSSNTSP